ncbi:MAG: ATP phosphoribosyltransferase regulatory subunit [Pelosinus sp.]|nr:ATP phosphoribosyltransferase regulatory subunit [Pelosinus sp.]
MKKNQFVPQLPYGTRDFLPKEAKHKRMVEESLAKLFSSWGYDEIVTPTFEYLETLSVSGGAELAETMFKFFDKKNSILALRADMTTPIARVAATRLRDNGPLQRLFYLTNVFRHEEAQAGRQCEFYQAGVELLGEADAAADAEVVALAVQAMLDAGLTNFQIGLGQVEFINGLMQESGLSKEECQQIKHCMVTRDLVGLETILAVSGVAEKTQQVIKSIPLLHGKEELLEKAYGMINNEVSRAALDNLAHIYQLLKYYGVEQYVNFDLGIIRDFDYYTGMVFEGYTPGLGFPICGGGRYDNMLSSFGAACPATGFALGIERILLALLRQEIDPDCNEREVYVGWNNGSLHKAIQEAVKLRQLGKTVELALTAQNREQAVESQKGRGFAEIIYFGD